MNQLLQSTRFEMYLLVTLHFDFAVGEGGAPLHGLYKYVQHQRDMFFFYDILSQKYSIEFGNFGLKLGMVFAL